MVEMRQKTTHRLAFISGYGRICGFFGSSRNDDDSRLFYGGQLGSALGANNEVEVDGI
jgi:hypothetical protein